jgi:hypothetical protein
MRRRYPDRGGVSSPEALFASKEDRMARLIRLDGTGHTTLAEWTAADDAAFEEAVERFRSQQELGYIGTVPDGPGKATHVRRLPREADIVIMRRPIAGG